MKTIYLLRHAKSARDIPGLADPERPLNARGEAAATAIGRHLAALLPGPDLVLASSARRTVDTAHLVLDAFAHRPPLAIEDGLYLADARTLAERLSDLGDAVDAVLLVGHNPGLVELALALPVPADRPAALAAIGKFPTAALAVLHLPAPHWPLLGYGRCRFVAVTTPKMLAA